MNNTDPEVGAPSEQAARPAWERSIWLLLAVPLAGAVLVLVWTQRPARRLVGQTAAAPAELVPAGGYRSVPDFSLIDQSGNPVTLEDLRGHVWIADFFFTSCPAQCPMMTERMARLQKSLPEGAPVKLVSITVDPDRDSPEVLASYAAEFGAREDRWLFLTGDKQAIIRLANDGFQLPATEDPNDHSLRLTLVDGRGRIRGYYQSLNDDSLGELEKRARELLEERDP